MKRNTHFVVPESRFTLIKGGDALTTYTFGTGVAKHQFCSTCGVQAFYRPRSNPDGVAVTIHCVEPESVGSITVRTFDGIHWEEHIESSDIKTESKVDTKEEGVLTS
jgi:hypothetical protein